MAKKTTKKVIPKPLKEDPCGPDELRITIEDGQGNKWTHVPMNGAKRQYSSGAVGYFIGGKVANPLSGEKYQCSLNFVLIGSKPP